MPSDSDTFSLSTLRRAVNVCSINLLTIVLTWCVAFSPLLFFLVLSHLCDSLSASAFNHEGTDLYAAISVYSQGMGKLMALMLPGISGFFFLGFAFLAFDSNDSVKPMAMYAVFRRRPSRHFVALLVYAVLTSIALFFVVIPGVLFVLLALILMAPSFVRSSLFFSRPLPAAFLQSFQGLYGSISGRRYCLTQLKAWLALFAVSLATCSVGLFLAVPVMCSYLVMKADAFGVITGTLPRSSLDIDPAARRNT